MRVHEAEARPGVEQALRAAAAALAQLPGGPDASAAACAQPGTPAAARAGLAALHSAAEHPLWGRWTILAAAPAAVIEAAHPAGPDPFATLAGRMREMATYRTSVSGLPFCGGWIGYLAYEAGRFLEHLPATTRDDVGLPAARFGLYGSAALFDHQQRRWHVVGVDLPDHPGAALTGEKGIAFWRRVLAEGERLAGPLVEVARPGIEQLDAFLGGMRPSLDERAFCTAVARAVEYIAAGDIYQVNLARRLTAPLRDDPLELYLRLCRANPAWYAAYLDLGGAAVLSSSPELHLQLRGQQVVTRPIKGTRPRVGDDPRDRRAAAELVASEKDRAELTMIVDLERNDLGRVCEFGSVRVSEPFGLEAHPTVWHLVGTVEGRLRAGHDAVDLLRATFPGGSITGAPKVRAMEIIDELEPVVRSVYCGGIGCISLDGQMTMNIAIRTLIAAAGNVHLYVGGGIVADSRPELELAETVAKARGMVRALMARG